MNIETTPHPADPEITLVTLSGRLDTLSEPAVAPRLLEAVEQGKTGTIIDLAHVDFLSSVGLRLLLQASKICAEKGKKLALTRAQPAVYKIFKLAGFEAAVHLFEDDVAAVEAFWKKTV